MAITGVVVGTAGGIALMQLAGSYFQDVKSPGMIPVAGSVLILLAAAIVASAVPAARAARVDVMQALRAE